MVFEEVPSASVEHIGWQALTRWTPVDDGGHPASRNVPSWPAHKSEDATLYGLLERDIEGLIKCENVP
jgi:hypothetical protein